LQKLTDHRLVLHLFAPLTGPDSATAHRQLDEVWRICEDRLGMTAEADPNTPTNPPPATADQRRRGTVAGRRTPGANLREAWWDETGDVACLSVTLSQDASAWNELHDEWAKATRALDLSPLLGQAFVFTALTGPGRNSQAQRRRAIEQDLPTGIRPLDPGWADSAVDLDAGVVAHRLDQASDKTPIRVMAVTAPIQHDTALGDRVWAPELGPMARYLLHAAKLGYQRHILDADRRGLRAQLTRVNDALDRLQAELATGPTALDDDALHRAQDELSLLRTDRSGIIDTSIQARRMRRTVQIAASNMAAVLPSGSGFAAADQRVAAEMDQDLDDLGTYLDAAAERARHIAEIADREATRRVRLRSEAARHRQERFTLTQTAIIGTLLMVLTAIQALSYRVPLPGPVKPALITTLGTAVLWLSVVALRLVAAPASRRSIECAAFGALVAAFTWLATSWLTKSISWIPVGPLATTLTSATGLIIGYVASSSWSRRSSI
jgi:hypothetical protein